MDEKQIRISITFPVGRAGTRQKNFDYETTSTPCPATCTMSSSPVIFPDGAVFACIGPVLTLKHNHPLRLGNLSEEPLETILDRAESNRLLHAIRIWGPGTLLSELESKGYTEPISDNYIEQSVCDACFKLMSNQKTVENLLEIKKDLEFTEKVAYGRVYFLNEDRMARRIIADGILPAEP